MCTAAQVSRLEVLVGEPSGAGYNRLRSWVSSQSNIRFSVRRAVGWRGANCMSRKLVRLAILEDGQWPSSLARSCIIIEDRTLKPTVSSIARRRPLVN
jgi:hypothetical protein